jgi:hypothetical protein
MSNPLPSDEVALELAIRSAIVEEMQLIDAGEQVRTKVFPRGYLIEGEKEWLEYAAVKRDGAWETRAVYVVFTAFREVDEGPCSNSQLTLSYDLDVVFAVAEKRKDGSNSHDDFVAYLMKARARFKANRSFGYAPNVVESGLLQTKVEAGVDDNFAGATVHRTNLGLDVVIDL